MPSEPERQYLDEADGRHAEVGRVDSRPLVLRKPLEQQRISRQMANQGVRPGLGSSTDQVGEPFVLVGGLTLARVLLVDGIDAVVYERGPARGQGGMLDIRSGTGQRRCARPV